MNSNSLIQLVTAAPALNLATAGASRTRPLPHSSIVLQAQVITRWAEGCHIRIANAHDIILPPDALPVNADRFTIRIKCGAVVLVPAA